VSESPQEKPPKGAEYAVQLPTFEGPLDLLLHLCQKHELDILEIPISFVTEKYLEYLAVMQLMQLDIASEYLVMAATLAYIKSRSLLPAPPPGQEDDVLAEEEEDPREALIRRLLEYQKYKQAAADLAGRGVAGRDIFLRGAAIEEAHEGEPAPLAEIPLYAIVEAFQRVLERSKVKISHEVITERVSLNDRIHELVDVLRARRRMTFDEIFDGVAIPGGQASRSRADLVITFLALLEMTRLRLSRLVQTEPLAPLYVESTSDDPVNGPAPLGEESDPNQEGLPS
jgi:segregation and condensation protein A